MTSRTRCRVTCGPHPLPTHSQLHLRDIFHLKESALHRLYEINRAHNLHALLVEASPVTTGRRAALTKAVTCSNVQFLLAASRKVSKRNKKVNKAQAALKVVNAFRRTSVSAMSRPNARANRGAAQPKGSSHQDTATNRSADKSSCAEKPDLGESPQIDLTDVYPQQSRDQAHGGTHRKSVRDQAAGAAARLRSKFALRGGDRNLSRKAAPKLELV